MLTDDKSIFIDQDPPVEYTRFIQSIPSTYIKHESDHETEMTYVYQLTDNQMPTRWKYTPTLMVVNFDTIDVDAAPSLSGHQTQNRKQKQNSGESKLKGKECLIQVRDSTKSKAKVTLTLFKLECNKLLKLGLDEDELKLKMHCLIIWNKMSLRLNNSLILRLLNTEPQDIDDIIPAKEHKRYSLKSWIYITTQTTFLQLKDKVEKYHRRHGVWFNIPSNFINSQTIRHRKIKYDQYFSFDCQISFKTFKNDLLNHIAQLADIYTKIDSNELKKEEDKQDTSVVKE